MTNIKWRDLSFHQRIALSDVAQFGAFHPNHALAGASLERAELIRYAPTEHNPRRWAVTSKGAAVLKGKGA